MVRCLSTARLAPALRFRREEAAAAVFVSIYGYQTALNAEVGLERGVRISGLLTQSVARARLERRVQDAQQIPMSGIPLPGDIVNIGVAEFALSDADHPFYFFYAETFSKGSSTLFSEFLSMTLCLPRYEGRLSQ